MIDVEKLKILIVEDDKVSLDFISLLVKNYSSEILKATTGIEAVELALAHEDIDLILMDIKLPGIDGCEATRRIRNFNKEVIIFAQTAYSLSGDREKTIAAGCNDFISKPIKKEDLLMLIEKYFGQ